MNYLQDIASRVREAIPADKLPDEDADDLLMSYAVLVESKGAEVTNEDVHDAWTAWMTKIDPDHGALIPYAELDAETKAQDSVFTEAIRRVARQINS